MHLALEVYDIVEQIIGIVVDRNSLTVVMRIRSGSYVGMLHSEEHHDSNQILLPSKEQCQWQRFSNCAAAVRHLHLRIEDTTVDGARLSTCLSYFRAFQPRLAPAKALFPSLKEITVLVNKNEYTAGVDILFPSILRNIDLIRIRDSREEERLASLLQLFSLLPTRVKGVTQLYLAGRPFDRLKGRVLMAALRALEGLEDLCLGFESGTTFQS